MGLYDTVMAPCPDCGTRSEFQSKGGACLLRTWTLPEEAADIPADVLSDVNRHAPNECGECGTQYYVAVDRTQCGHCGASTYGPRTATWPPPEDA